MPYKLLNSPSLLFIFIILVISCLPISLSAQKDSLILLYENATTDTARLKALNDVNGYFKYKAFTLEKEAYLGLYLKEAKQQNDSLHICRAYNHFASFFLKKGEYDKQEDCLKKAVSMIKKSAHTEKTGIIFLNLFSSLFRQNKFKESFVYFSKAQQKATLCVCPDLRGIIHFNLGYHYSFIKDYENAIDHYKQSTQYNNTTNSLQFRFLSYLNIADINLNLNQLDSAEYYLNIALEVFVKKNRTKYLTMAYNQQSKFYFLKEDFELSLIYTEKAILLSDSLNHKWGQIMGRVYKTKTYLKLKDTKNAQICYEEINEWLKNNLESLNFLEKIEVYMALLTSYKEQDKEKALNYALKINALEDAIQQQRHATHIALFSIENEIQLQALKKAQLQQEAALKAKAIRNLQFGLLGLGILSCLLLYGFWQIRRKNQTIHFKNNQLKKLNYTISHDGLVYISNILSYANFSLDLNLLEKKHPLAPQLYNIQRTARQLKRMMRNIILSFKLEGKQEVVLTRIALEDIVQGVLDNLAITIKATNADIQIDPLPIVQANREMMIQLFQNLITNAFKYKKEKVRPKLRIYHQLMDTHHKIIIADNGIGIPKEKLISIFNLFTQVADNPVQDFGLGLSICKQIVEWHKGEIYVESEVNQGSRFCFTLLKTTNLAQNKVLKF